MTIADLPRPWFLAAMTGVPMSALLAQADEEDAKEPEPTARCMSHDKRERPGGKHARSWPRAGNRRCGRTRLAARFRLLV
jgi:hypothetical protein